MFLGLLSHAWEEQGVSLPGGCAIGARPVDLHLKGLELLGAEIKIEHGYIDAIAPKLKGAVIYLDTVTVTGTENLMMAAVLAEGEETILQNAAMEPEVVALADVLKGMGADIEGAGTPEIRIRGKASLSPVKASIIPDRIEVGTYMVAAALTGGDVTVTGCNPHHMMSVMDKPG